MHYNGPVIRPPHEAYSVIVETTVGCTHNSCRFCTFYKGTPFHMAPLSQIESDLQEAAAYNPHAPRVWASGGDPFTMATGKLVVLADLIRKYFPKANIAMYGRVDSMRNKTVEDIRLLRQHGINDLVIGIETGDDDTLSLQNKGYTAGEMLKNLQMLEDGGMDYRIIYLAGIAGHERFVENARRTANLLNKLRPTFMYLTSLTIQEDSLLYKDIQSGRFQPQTELDKIKEFGLLIRDLKNPLEINATAGYNPIRFTAMLPQDKEQLLKEIEKVVAGYTEETEERLALHRARYGTV